MKHFGQGDPELGEVVQSRMARMKYQFTTKSILWATAFLGVSIGGFMPFWKTCQGFPRPPQDVLIFFLDEWLDYAPITLPFIFGAYALGRRKVTWQMMLAYVATQSGTYFLSRWL